MCNFEFEMLSLYTPRKLDFIALADLIKKYIQLLKKYDSQKSEFRTIRALLCKK